MQDRYTSMNGGRNNRNYNQYGNSDMPFAINEPVRHIGTGIKLIVIRYGREQVECRKPDLTSDYFYLYELEPWSVENGD